MVAVPKGLKGKQHQRMEVTRAHALREAVSLFLIKGYNDNTLGQIAERIDRSKAALLRAYPDKEAILYALVPTCSAHSFQTCGAYLVKKLIPC